MGILFCITLITLLLLSKTLSSSASDQEEGEGVVLGQQSSRAKQPANHKQLAESKRQLEERFLLRWQKPEVVEKKKKRYKGRSTCRTRCRGRSPPSPSVGGAAAAVTPPHTRSFLLLHIFVGVIAHLMFA
ncbi:hypothetical protein Ancab_027644 [Ancistrocladus abbreviatus]